MNEEFKKFVTNFNLNERSIKLKYDHSLRVQKISEDIAKSENLDKHESHLASVIGLLHDYGRFYQWTKYKTFKDSISIDHGTYAAEELISNNKIKPFYKEEKDYKVIYEAIKYHNKYKVPNNVKNKTLCNIIRDADKLDIITMYKEGQLNINEEGEISEKVKQSFYSHTLVNNSDIKSKIDVMIRTLSLIYDLNFKHSYKYIKENKVVEKIFGKIKDKQKLEKYFIEINNYIERRIKKC